MGVIFVFRNATLEPLAGTLFDAVPANEIAFSDYNSVEKIPENADEFAWFYTFPFDVAAENLAQTLDAFIAALKVALAGTQKPFRVVKIAVPAQFSVALENDPVAEQVARYNAELERLSAAFPRLRVIAFPPEILNNIDWRFYFLTRLAFSPKLPKKSEFSEHSEFSECSEKKKCLILDLDNTLWHGVLDEDSPDCGNDYPGNAFRFFQLRLRELAAAGTLLALNSKNDFSAVEQAFAAQKMPLELSDFSAIRCNWQDKATNLREIAAELNIGLDSLVFVDDSPAERAWVAQALPEVAVPEFPRAPYEIPEFYADLLAKFFRSRRLTAEDFAKKSQYSQNAARAKFADDCTNFDDYLAQLKTKLSLQINVPATFPRLEQISQKTNQFNLCNARLRERDFYDLRERGALIFALSVRDIFGDSGIVGLAICAPAFGGETSSSPIEASGSYAGDEDVSRPKIFRGNAAFDLIEFALSCRVLGRRIERDFLAKVLEELRSCGGKSLRAKFVPTAKNQKYANFFAENGFSPSAGMHIFVTQI